MGVNFGKSACSGLSRIRVLSSHPSVVEHVSRSSEQWALEGSSARFRSAKLGPGSDPQIYRCHMRNTCAAKHDFFRSWGLRVRIDATTTAESIHTYKYIHIYIYTCIHISSSLASESVFARG